MIKGHGTTKQAQSRGALVDSQEKEKHRKLNHEARLKGEGAVFAGRVRGVYGH